jgi:hypothetical protein
VAQGDTLDVGRVRRLLRALDEAIDQSDLLACFEEQMRVARSGR